MGVGSVTSMNSISSMWMTTAGSTDVKSKNIQNEITEIQQQMQKLSSEEELSVDEKVNERKKQQTELSSLNAELKRHQEELLKSQKREMMMAELQKDEEPAEEEKSAVKIQTDETGKKDIAEKDTKTIDGNIDAALSYEKMPAAAPADLSTQSAGHQGTVIFQNSDGIVILKEEMNQNEKRGVDADQKQTDETKEEGPAERETKSIDDDTATGLSHKEMYAIVSADASAQQASHQETIIARISGDIAVLKGEIKQDEKRGVDTDKKQAELEKLEKREERAMTFQFPNLSESNSTMRSAAKAKDSRTQINTENNAFINVSKLSKEEAQASQQRFHVSLGN